MNEAQRKTVQGGLRELEEFLMDLVAELAGGKPLRQGTLIREVDPLPRDPGLEGQAQDLLTRVRGLAERLGLETTERSRRRTRLAQMALLWAYLEDLRPEALGRYGPWEEKGWDEAHGALVSGFLALMEGLEKRG